MHAERQRDPPPYPTVHAERQRGSETASLPRCASERQRDPPPYPTDHVQMGAGLSTPHQLCSMWQRRPTCLTNHVLSGSGAALPPPPIACGMALDHSPYRIGPLPKSQAAFRPRHLQALLFGTARWALRKGLLPLPSTLPGVLNGLRFYQRGHHDLSSYMWPAVFLTRHNLSR